MKQKKQQDSNKKKQFRLRGKKLFLTYSQLNLADLNTAKKEILQQLEELIPHKIVQYVICEEKHEDTGTHFHVYLEFHQRVELFKSTCLDLVFNDVVYHGKYETVRKKDAALRYIVKAGNFISYPELPFLDGELYIDFREYLTQLHKKGGISLVKSYLIKNPLVMVKGGSRVLKNLEEVDALEYKEKIDEMEQKSILPVEYFEFPNLLHEWWEDGCKETIILCGFSGTGKTEGMKAFLKGHNISFLLIRNIHGLALYNPKIHKAIIFDDIYFENPLSEEQHISLSDVANSSDVRILRNSIRLIQNTIKILTTNNIKNLFTGIDLNTLSGQAILSRYLIINVNKSLFKENIEIDVEIKIRDKSRQKKIYEHNLKTLKEINKQENNLLNNPNFNVITK